MTSSNPYSQHDEQNREIIDNLRKLKNSTAINREQLLEQEFAKLVEANNRFLLHYLRLYWHGQNFDAEDILQEFWILLLEKLPNFDNQRSFRLYAQGIIHKMALKKYRRQKTFDKIYNILSLQQREVPTQEVNPQDEQVEKLLYALGRLNPQEYQIIYWRYFEKMPIKTICSLLDKSRSTVMELLGKIRRKLRNLMEEKN